MKKIINIDNKLDAFCINYIKDNLKNSFSENIEFLSKIQFNNLLNNQIYLDFINAIMKLKQDEPNILTIQKLNKII